MICTWLVHGGQFNESQDVLDFFGDRRTDKTFSNKYQGVETPSQSRYVDYYTKLVKELDNIIPLPVELQLVTFKITEMSGK